MAALYGIAGLDRRRYRGMVCGNTAVAVMMLAEKAANMIREAARA